MVALQSVSPRALWTRFRALSTARQVTAIALFLIVLQLVFRAWLVAGSWFYADDFVFLSDIAQGQDDLHWYLRLYQGHFMPFSFLLVKAASGFGAYPWTAVAVEIVVMQLVASLACWWMLRTLFGSRPLILLLLGAYLLSPLTVEASTWWAVAINQLPHQVAVFGAVSAHVIYARTGRHRWAFISTAFLLLGFASYTKTLLLPVMLGLLSLLYFSTGAPARRLATVVRTQWLAFSLYAIVSGAFLYSYTSRLPANVEQGSDLYNLASTTVLSSLGSALIGGPWSVASYLGGPITEATPPHMGVVAAWVILFVGIVWIWGRRERALRAITLPLTYVAISVFIIYSGRGFALSIIGGVHVGQALRYLGDATPILVLATALMLLPLRGAVESSAPRSTPLVAGSPPRLLVAGLALVVASGSIVSTVLMTSSWRSNYVERAFTQNAERTVKSEDPLFADATVPERIMPKIASPYDRIAEYLAPLRDDLRITTVGNDLSVLDIDGEAVDAHVEGSPRTSENPASTCPYKAQFKARTISFAPVVNFGFWLGIDYRTNMSGTVQLDYGSRHISVPVENGGPHTLFVQTSDEFDSITLTPLIGQRICVSAVRVGYISDRETR